MSEWICDPCKTDCHNACEIESCNDVKCSCELCIKLQEEMSKQICMECNHTPDERLDCEKNCVCHITGEVV